MSNTITIELCAEDRARLDRIAGLLEANIEASLKVPKTPTAKEDDRQLTIDPEALKPAETTEAPKTATGEAEASAPPVTPAEEETPTAKEDAPAKVAKPTSTVTLEQIQQKVVQLAAGNGGAKKAKVREIINAYGAKVSDLKDQPEKWAEVWDKLTALESEG